MCPLVLLKLCAPSLINGGHEVQYRAGKWQVGKSKEIPIEIENQRMPRMRHVQSWGHRMTRIDP